MVDPALTVRIATPFAAAVPLVKEALGTQGFGVLTEIDVRATMQTKLGEEMEDYLILGACNPPLAHRALTADRRIGLLLPCNVVVRADGDGTLVEAVDPRDMFAAQPDAAAELAPVAAEVAERLAKVIEVLPRG
ncbi:MAG: DUF302 domain-containing protein [Actinomycetia bacterium]|jgi:uncharacterized protein (DUF302 family)|nr:DUF302 domain-containing protein [Actinomycetes bacterium]